VTQKHQNNVKEKAGTSSFTYIYLYTWGIVCWHSVH